MSSLDRRTEAAPEMAVRGVRRSWDTARRMLPRIVSLADCNWMAAFSALSFFIHLIEGLGVLFPADSLNGLLLDPGSKGAHDTGDSHHGQHGNRVTRMAQGKGGIGDHKKVVDAEGPYDGGGDPIGIAGGKKEMHTTANTNTRAELFSPPVWEIRMPLVQ